MNNTNILRMPPQAVSDSTKRTKEWQESTIDSMEHILMYDTSTLRQSFYNKQVNYNLRRNILNLRDFEKVINPQQLEVSSFPANLQHIGIGNAKLNLLIGEEKRRTDRYDYKAYISSSDQFGISEKEKNLKNYVAQQMQQMATQGLEGDELELKLQELQKYSRYEYQDIREIVANKILKYEYIDKELRDKFLVCFEDLLIAGEEIMCIEELGNDLSVRRVDPRRFFTIQSPDSNKVEDADVIVEFTYMSPGQVIDRYYNVLKRDQVKDIDDGNFGLTMNYGGARQMLNREITIEERYGNNQGELLMANNNASYFYGSPHDRAGNIRVMKCSWRSRRLVGELIQYDEFGQEYKELVDESYKSIQSKSDVINWFYINEWWEGTKIGTEIYVNVRPIPFQGRSTVNISESKPPYVGTYMHSGGNNRAFSLMDMIKPLDYLYDIYSYRRELAMATYHGPILAINSSLIPSDWDPKMWMHYVTTMKIMMLDPTNEVLKGPSQGKSAGAFNTLTAQSIDSPMGNFIREHTLMMDQIKRDMDIISGVNDYRQGQIKSEAAVGTAEMAYTASNSMTEKIFHLHASFKRRVMERVLDVGKYVWQKNPKRCQVVLNDLAIEMIETYDEFFESDYDIHVGNSSSDEELMQALKQLAHAAMQNGQASFKQIIEIYRTDSIAAVARKLEEAEDEAIRRAQEAEQAKAEAQERLQQMALEDKQFDRDLEMYKIDTDNMNKQLDRETKIQVEIIKAMGFAQDTDVNQNLVPDVIEQGKLALQQQEVEYDQHIRELERKDKKEAENKKKEIEDKKIKLKEQEIKAKKDIELTKLKQVTEQNKNQEKLAYLKMKLDREKMQSSERTARIKAKRATK